MIKPILFNTEMVRAILEGRKTVTRRVVKGQGAGWELVDFGDNTAMIKVRPNGEEYPVDVPGLWATFEWDGVPEFPMVKAPCESGDCLWVRETWSRVETGEYLYKADNEKPFSYLGWRPSIHMPKEAARLFLRVIGVRAERLQDISAKQAHMEGQPRCNGGITVCGGPRSCYDCEADTENAVLWFAGCWDSTIKPADCAAYGWEANPWVWVIEFERCEKPEGF